MPHSAQPPQGDAPSGPVPADSALRPKIAGQARQRLLAEHPAHQRCQAPTEAIHAGPFMRFACGAGEQRRDRWRRMQHRHRCSERVQRLEIDNGGHVLFPCLRMEQRSGHAQGGPRRSVQDRTRRIAGLRVALAGGCRMVRHVERQLAVRYSDMRERWTDQLVLP